MKPMTHILTNHNQSMLLTCLIYNAVKLSAGKRKPLTIRGTGFARSDPLPVTQSVNSIKALKKQKHEPTSFTFRVSLLFTYMIYTSHHISNRTQHRRDILQLTQSMYKKANGIRHTKN